MLLEMEQDQSFNPVKVGLRTGLPIVTDQNVAPDHAFDQTFTLTVSNTNTTFGSSINANLIYDLNGEDLFSTSNTGAPPVSLPAIAQTAPFDATTPHLEVTIANRNNPPNGRVELVSEVSGNSDLVASSTGPRGQPSPGGVEYARDFCAEAPGGAASPARTAGDPPHRTGGRAHGHRLHRGAQGTGILIRMDGLGGCHDNIFIAGLGRSLSCEEASFPRAPPSS